MYEGYGLVFTAMGCNQSKGSSESTTSNSTTSNSTNTKKEWKGVLKGAQLLVKDKFTSSLTGIIIIVNI